jgi:hypothetical protein
MCFLSAYNVTQIYFISNVENVIKIRYCVSDDYLVALSKDKSIKIHGILSFQYLNILFIYFIIYQ